MGTPMAGREDAVLQREPNHLCNVHYWVTNPEVRWPGKFWACDGVRAHGLLVTRLPTSLVPELLLRNYRCHQTPPPTHTHTSTAGCCGRGRRFSGRVVLLQVGGLQLDQQPQHVQQGVVAQGASPILSREFGARARCTRAARPPRVGSRRPGVPSVCTTCAHHVHALPVQVL